MVPASIKNCIMSRNCQYSPKWTAAGVSGILSRGSFTADTTLSKRCVTPAPTSYLKILVPRSFITYAKTVL